MDKTLAASASSPGSLPGDLQHLPTDLARHYLTGGCASMAWALAQLGGLEVGLLRANRVTVSGDRTQIDDVVHAYAVAGDNPAGEQLVADIKGIRTFSAMAADFEWLKALLHTQGTLVIDFEAEDLDDPDDLFTLEGFDPSGLGQAIEDARTFLSDHFNAADLTFTDSCAPESAAESLMIDDEPSLLF